jgi:hypothetical protein
LPAHLGSTLALTGTASWIFQEAETRCRRRSLMNPCRPRPITSPLRAGSAHAARTRRARDHHRRGTGRYHSRVTDPVARARTARPATIETLSLRTGPPMQPIEASRGSWDRRSSTAHRGRRATRSQPFDRIRALLAGRTVLLTSHRFSSAASSSPPGTRRPWSTCAAGSTGLPLAIELAAVRTRVLTVEQILDRLTDRFGLLTGGGTVPHQQTQRTTIDWSHDPLTAGEQTLLRRVPASVRPATGPRPLDQHTVATGAWRYT